MSDQERYEERCLEKLWLVIKSAEANFPGDCEVELVTKGFDPRYSVRLPAHILSKFITKKPKD